MYAQEKERVELKRMVEGQKREWSDRQEAAARNRQQVQALFSVKHGWQGHAEACSCWW